MVVSLYLKSGDKHEIEIPIVLSMKKELMGIVESQIIRAE
jgi:hypothetical protein